MMFERYGAECERIRWTRSISQSCWTSMSTRCWRERPLKLLRPRAGGRPRRKKQLMTKMRMHILHQTPSKRRSTSLSMTLSMRSSLRNMKNKASWVLVQIKERLNLKLTKKREALTKPSSSSLLHWIIYKWESEPTPGPNCGRVAYQCGTPTSDMAESLRSKSWTQKTGKPSWRRW